MPSRRLFFALWLDDEAAHAAHRQATELAEHIGGRVMRADSLHLTLAFLGKVDASHQPALLALGNRCASGASPFSMVLDRHIHWPHNRIVCATCSAMPTALPALADALRAGIRLQGLSTDQRPFFPHLTLLRNAPDAPPSAMLPHPVRITATRLQLTESVPQPSGGYDYQCFGDWPLGG